jgi:SH3 domain protein
MKRMMMTASLWLASFSALAQTPTDTPVPAGGQKAYVSERLILGLYAQPDPATPPVKSLQSGMQVEILETRDGFARVRMVDGSEGWARAEFITTEAPAKVLLQQMTRERDRLREQLNTHAAGEQQLTAQIAQARQKIQQLEQQLANPQSSGESAEEYLIRYQQAQRKIADLERQLEGRAGPRPADSLAIKILGLLATLLMSIGLGAVLGARWLGARVRRRFNGLKVW